MSNSEQNTDYVRVYLSEIGRYPLLTREQEISYGQQVQQMVFLKEAKEILSKKLRRQPTLEEWALHAQMSEGELTQKVQRGQRAKQKMIEANLRLVVSIAKKYQKRNLEFLDLIQEGTIGLARGIEKFDPTRGYKLSTYIYWWIRQAITRALAEKSRTIRLPIHITEKLNKIKQAQRHLSQELGRTATVSEVAKKLKLSPAQILSYVQCARSPISLDLPVGDNSDTELIELLEDSRAIPESEVIRSCLASDLDSIMSELKPQGREVLSLSFGLKDGQELTLNQVGSRLNRSREWIRQIRNKSLNKMRKHEHLQSYLLSS